MIDNNDGLINAIIFIYYGSCSINYYYFFIIFFFQSFFFILIKKKIPCRYILILLRYSKYLLKKLLISI